MREAAPSIRAILLRLSSIWPVRCSRDTTWVFMLGAGSTFKAADTSRSYDLPLSVANSSLVSCSNEDEATPAVSDGDIRPLPLTLPLSPLSVEGVNIPCCAATSIIIVSIALERVYLVTKSWCVRSAAKCSKLEDSRRMRKSSRTRTSITSGASDCSLVPSLVAAKHSRHTSMFL